MRASRSSVATTAHHSGRSAAFSDPDLKRQWFSNPDDLSQAEWELDFRVGGREL
jgi:hypothetical protein